MPAEPMTVLLRPRHFFSKNPALDVPPSFVQTATEAARAKEAGPAGSCCAKDGSVLV